MIYRAYTPSWERAGWRTEPQYAGQQPCVNGMDFPGKCPSCGGEIVGTAIPKWMAVRGAPELSPPIDTAARHVAWCAKNHRIDLRPIPDWERA